MLQLVEATGLVGQPVGELLEVAVRLGRQPRARDPQRQRQVAALAGDRRRGRGLSLHPAGPRDAAQQGQRLARIEHVRLDAGGTGQSAEPAPAGDQHRGGAAAWKQRGNLALVRRVVQHDQHPAVGQQVAVRLGALVQAVRYLRARYAQRPQKPLEHLHRAHRMGGTGVQVSEQLPVAERPGHAVRRVHGQAGLAHAALTGNHHHRDREPGLAGPGQPAMDLADLLGPVGEVSDIGGQQPRDPLPGRPQRDWAGLADRGPGYRP